MADNPEQNEGGPKDVTPSPMDDLLKNAEAESASQAPAAAPVDQTAAAGQPEGPGPQNLKALMKESFLDSRAWNRILQLACLIAGLFGVFISIKGQEFMPLPAVLGGLAFAITVLLDIYIIKKFRKQYEKLEITARIALAIILGLLTITFGIEFFRKFGLSLNKNLIWAGLAAVVAVFAVNFFMYISKNRGKLLADIYMFVSVIMGIIALYFFYTQHVIISFVLALISMMSLVSSITKDPLKDDERYQTRLLVTSLSILMFAGIFAYSLTIFVNKPMNVITYGPITDVYNNKPQNLGWSGDSWSFDYNVFDKNKNESSIGILNALSLGITELPPGAHAEITLPKFVDEAVWNKNGGSLIFTAGDSEGGARSIWAVALNLSLVEHELEKAKKEAREKAEQEAKDRETLQGEVKAELKKSIVKITGADKQSALNIRTKQDDETNKPVGRKKVLLADMNLIVDKQCRPVTHRTAWSPEGRKFCFAAKDHGSGGYNIWSADVKSQEITKLTSGKSKVMPLWSPAGYRILYCTKTENYSALIISDYNGSNARELSIKNKRDRELFPLWNKDESKVIYIKRSKFVVMNANATNQRDLSEATLPKSDYWLTDAKKKVKLGFNGSGTIWRVWTMNTRGEKQKNIFTERCEEMTQPKWSYDGNTIALGANYRDGSGSVWRFSKEGKLRTRLFTSNDRVAELEWANTSKRLAFLVKRNKPKIEELWVVENDGTEPRSLYETSGELDHISWNDLGTFIAFDETINRWYFVDPVTTVRVAEARGEDRLQDLLPYEFYGQYPTWSNDGQVLAYVSWNKYWTPFIGIGIGYGKGNRLWIAQLQ
jgi:Tol biopolymer transport system component